MTFVTDTCTACASNHLNPMVTFRCSNLESCSAGFPLSENTKEKLIHCPMADCGAETNVWLKLKKIHELKALHAVRTLKVLMVEWEKILFRPYEDVSRLDRDLRVVLMLQHADADKEWMQQFKDAKKGLWTTGSPFFQGAMAQALEDVSCQDETKMWNQICQALEQLSSSSSS